MVRAGPLLFLCVLVACAAPVDLRHQAPATLPQEPPGAERAFVTRVVDGDTIEVRITERVAGPGAGGAPIGSIEKVRLIGIDTPESVRTGTPIECFGRESSAATEALLEGLEVALVKDVEEHDQYGRLLRYVYIGEEMANARLVVNGYAQVYTYPPNIRWSELFVQLQREAHDADRGLWSPDSCNGES